MAQYPPQGAWIPSHTLGRGPESQRWLSALGDRARGHLGGGCYQHLYSSCTVVQRGGVHSVYPHISITDRRATGMPTGTHSPTGVQHWACPANVQHPPAHPHFNLNTQAFPSREKQRSSCGPGRDDQGAPPSLQTGPPGAPPQLPLPWAVSTMCSLGNIQNPCPPGLLPGEVGEGHMTLPTANSLPVRMLGGGPGAGHAVRMLGGGPGAGHAAEGK